MGVSFWQRRHIACEHARYAAVPGGSAPTWCWRALSKPAPGVRRGTNPSGAASRCRKTAAICRSPSSTSAKVPEKRAARQSGSRLKVR